MHIALPARAALAAAGLSLALAAPTLAHPDHNQPTKFAGAAKRTAAKTKAVTVSFAAVAGTTPVTCSTPIAGVGATGKTANLKDLRFYVSDVRLTRPSGRAVPVTLTRNAFQAVTPRGSVTLIDLENGKGACAEDGNAAMNPSVRGVVPAGTYTGVRYTVGVPFALNHTDVAAAPAPLNVTAMGWSWQVGRKFTKIEISDPAGAGEGMAMKMRRTARMDMTMPAPAAPAAPGAWQAGTFFVHIGSIGCTGNPASGQTVKCSTPNRAKVRLGSFDAAKQKIAVDLKALFAHDDVTKNAADAPGCMSGPEDPECAGIFRAFGIGWKADGSGTGTSPSARQTVFRAMAR